MSPDVTTATRETARPDPREATTAEQRLAVIADLAAVRWTSPPVRVPSWSNDTWLFDDPARGACVLRICWRGDPGRLITESRVGRAAPAAVGVPQVLGFGCTRDALDLTWSLTRRWPGRSLGDVWDELDPAARDRASAAVATRLRALHRWRPSAYLTDRLLSWPRRTDPVGVFGATLNPLPLPRVRVLAAAARTRPGVDAALVDAALEWLAGHPDLAPDLDRPGLEVTHGDLHLHNVWWDDTTAAVRGLLDLEWVRLGPGWLDLARVADNLAEDAVEGLDQHAEFLDRLLHHAPELRVDRLDQRIRYVRTAYQLRALFSWPEPGPDPAPDHPVRQLAALLDGSGPPSRISTGEPVDQSVAGDR